MMPTRLDQAMKFAGAGVLIALALIRLAYHASLAGRMDSVFFALIGVALLLLLVPLDRVRSLKAAGLEFSLDQPQVQGAITGLGLDRIHNQEIRARLARMPHQLAVIRGSRVLWIDDRPHTILGERRLLRALGVEVVHAISSEQAEHILGADNDFDLLITDVQRAGTSYRRTGGIDIHEGVNFLVTLRTDYPDPQVRALPVIFYAAYPWTDLVEWTRPAWEHLPSPDLPKPELANSALDLVPKVVKLLADARATPILAKEKKTPTSLAQEDSTERSGGEEEEEEETPGPNHN